MHPSHNALALSGYQHRVRDHGGRETGLVMTNRKPTSGPSLGGHGILEALASCGMAALLHSTSIQKGILGALERPARKTASPRLELGGGGCWASNRVWYQDASLGYSAVGTPHPAGGRCVHPGSNHRANGPSRVELDVALGGVMSRWWLDLGD